MLTYEALTRQAEERGMPPGKARGVLREYLQVLILKELRNDDTGKEFFFTGGTYLRLVKGLKRFSEDLDFNTTHLTRDAFERWVTQTARVLTKQGMTAEARFSHWGNILSGALVFPDIEKAYGVVSAHSKKEGISIKIETNTPRWKIAKETSMVSGFGEFFPVICTDKAALFADKVDALVKKTRARHLYDIIFMLSNRYPIDMAVVSALGIKGDPLDVITGRVLSFPAAELKKQAESLRPFLFDEKEADLIVNAHTVIPSLIDGYRAWGNGMEKS